MEGLIKARSYPIGTIRTWKDGSKYKKVAVGKWVEVEDRGSIIKEIQGLLRKAISALTRLKLLSKDYQNYLSKGDYNKALDEVEKALPEIDRIVTTYMENKTRERKSTGEKKEKKQKAEYEESREGKELKGKIKEVVKEVGTIKDQLKALKEKYGDKLDDALKARIDSVVKSLEKIEKKYNSAKEKPEQKTEQKPEQKTEQEQKEGKEEKELQEQDEEIIYNTITDNKLSREMIGEYQYAYDVREKKRDAYRDMETAKTKEEKEEARKKYDELDKEYTKHTNKYKALKTKTTNYILENEDIDQIKEHYNKYRKLQEELNNLSYYRVTDENISEKQKIINTIPILEGFDLKTAYKKQQQGNPEQMDLYEKILRITTVGHANLAELYQHASKRKLLMQKKEKYQEEMKNVPEKEKPVYLKDETVLDVGRGLSKEIAERAYRFISFDPEKRAESAVNEYKEYITKINDKFAKWATADNIDEMREDLKDFRDKYLSLLNGILHARSKTASTMITGGSNFPVEKNRKKLQAEQNKIDEADKWIEKTLNRLERKYNPNLITPIKSDDPEVIIKLKQKIKDKEEELEQNKKMVKIIKDKKLTREQKKQALKEINDKIGEHGANLIIDHGGSYMTNNKRQELNRLKDRLEILRREHERQDSKTEEEKVKTIKGVEVIENTENQRLQLKFPKKPSLEVIRTLKSNGFKWSPTSNAWQRLLNGNARYAATMVLRQIEDQS